MTQAHKQEVHSRNQPAPSFGSYARAHATHRPQSLEWSKSHRPRVKPDIPRSNARASPREKSLFRAYMRLWRTTVPLRCDLLSRPASIPENYSRTSRPHCSAISSRHARRATVARHTRHPLEVSQQRWQYRASRITQEWPPEETSNLLAFDFARELLHPLVEAVVVGIDRKRLAVIL